MEVKLPPHAAHKKVVYVITKSNWGGAQRYVYDLATAVKEQGFDVLVAAGGKGELLTRLREKGIAVADIETYQRDIHVMAEWRAFRELYRLLKVEKPDVLHVNSSKAGLAALAGRLAGVPKILFTVHGWAWNEKRPWYQIILIWCAYYLTLLLCNNVIIVSNAARTQAHFPFMRHRMRIIRNGIAPFPLLAREEARKRLLSPATDDFWIGSISELHPIKGLPTVIEAYEHFAADVPRSELVVIGEGEMRSRLERQITIEGVGRTAHLAGRVEDASSYLNAFDVLVLGSRSEGLPYVLLEAGIAGIPVVATRVGGIPEIIDDHESGLLVPYGDREAMTTALLYLSEHSDVREKYARNLREKIRTTFSLERMVEETVALYESH